MFELPRGVTGFGIDSPAAEVAARRDAFITWARAVAAELGSAAVECPLDVPVPSFDTVELARLDCWLLHNRYVPLVGVLTTAPEPGGAWAVAGEWWDLEIPPHLTTWGPPVLAADELNAPLRTSLDELGPGAREQADRYKPETAGHLIFNYWV